MATWPGPPVGTHTFILVMYRSTGLPYVTLWPLSCFCQVRGGREDGGKEKGGRGEEGKRGGRERAGKKRERGRGGRESEGGRGGEGGKCPYPTEVLMSSTTISWSSGRVTAKHCDRLFFI